MIEELLPIFAVIITIIVFLLYALYINFIPGECIPIGITEHINDKHIYYETVDSINMLPSTEPINFKLLASKKSEINNIFSEILFITGNIKLGKQLMDNCLLEFTNNNIYNVTLDNNCDNITVYLWNNSSALKGVKLFKKMITLKPNMLLSLECKDYEWSINDISLLEENRDVYNRYIIKRCHSILNNEISFIQKYCYDISDEFNLKLKHNNDLTDKSLLCLELYNKLNKIKVIFDKLTSYDLLERLKNIKGCIFTDCNFINDEDLLKDIDILISVSMSEYRNFIDDMIKIAEFTNNNSLKNN